jgi:4-amino-4-deoxy-L-arabinose transferase-like glycosyltransferase
MRKSGVMAVPIVPSVSTRCRFRSAATSPWLILVAALIFRLGFAWNYEHHNPRQALSVLPFLFESGNIAYSLATGNGFSSPFRVPTGPTAWMTPVYPALLAGVYRVFGTYTFPTFLAASFLNILFSALVCLPLFFAGKRVCGAGVAAGAAWLWAIFPNAIQIPVESMWDACLAALLAATILWATLALEKSRRLRDWCAYGLLWGLALMTSAAMASLLPFLLAWLAYRARLRSRADASSQTRNGTRSWLVRPALAAVVAILCCVPWTIRNYKNFHSFVPLRSVAGLQLWLGNNPESRYVWLGTQHPIFNADERAQYAEMGEIAYMREKRGLALRFMLSHPRREAQLIWHRFLALWAGGTPYPVKDLMRARSWWFRFVLLFNVLAAIGALLGIVVLIRMRNAYAFPVAVFPVIFPCVYYLTLALPRYRLPIDPVVMLLAAIALANLRSGNRAAQATWS